MDQIEKFVKKLNKQLSQRIRHALLDIVALRLTDYDVKKMEGYPNLYRIRVGKIRIIFCKHDDCGQPIYIGFRGEAYQHF